MTLSPDALRNQYEKHPYPPIPFLALPRRSEGAGLRYPGSAPNPRILIAGCGTFEPAVVAQAHPGTSEILAVDLSEPSLQIARRRIRWMKFARPFSPVASVRFLAADVAQLSEGEFDYILASNVLQHSSDPAALLSRLSAQLRSGGILRIVTYPKGSRYWMRRTSQWLRNQGLGAESADLVRRARAAIQKLRPSDPIRSSFESQPETRTWAGLLDAFFNACENPLGPLEWRDASDAAGLTLVREGQNEHSRSDFLDEFLKDPRALSAWEKLQILDDTWELCSNPVLWFEKTGPGADRALPKPTTETLQDQLKRAELLLAKAGHALHEYQDWLLREVGPRVSPRHASERLRGLSLTEYDLLELFKNEPACGEPSIGS